MPIEIKAGQSISAQQLMNKFAEKINVDLSNMPILPCNKGRNRKN